MRNATVVYAAAIVAGAALALVGSEPLWLPAVVALLAFPLAAALADRRSEPGGRRRGARFAAAALAASAGGLLTTLALRLALDAPGWLSPTAADCGGPSTGTQQLVLWSAAVVFAAAAAPVAVTLVRVGRGLAPAGSQPDRSPSPLNLYPLAVAASGVALIAAGYVTRC